MVYIYVFDVTVYLTVYICLMFEMYVLKKYNIQYHYDV